MSSTFTVAGIMSGTSLDGLDMAICRFEEESGRWNFAVLAADTLPYTHEWTEKLEGAPGLSGEQLMFLHASYGRFIGECINQFCFDSGIYPQLIASHGHTLFHQPQNGFTFQLGCGASIAAITGIDTVSDFRSTDISLGGQGAPLVPAGDQILFGGHRFCLNLGGIANVSFEKDHQRLAFDICPVNMALNYLARQSGEPYDAFGDMAREGNLQQGLLKKLNAISFYREKPPKSLSREWFAHSFQPLLDEDPAEIIDKLRTVTEHIALQVAESLFASPGTTVLTTGGGAYNHFLVETIEEKVSRLGIHVVIPDDTVVQFKEALIFALLGLFRYRNQHNVFSTTTGSTRNSSGGAIYKGWK